MKPRFSPRFAASVTLTAVAVAAVAAALAPSPAAAQADRAADALARSFAEPPDAARPHTWWHWINGNVSRAGITADLEAMKRVGIGGAQVFNVDVGVPAGKVGYLSQEWLDAMAHAAKEADRLGIELCFHNCAGWSSSGGPWVTPEHSMQILTWSETPVAGGARYAGKLPQPPTKAGWYKDIAVVAVRKPAGSEAAKLADPRHDAAFERGGIPDPRPGTAGDGPAVSRADVVVLACGPGGALEWQAPAGGEWTLILFGHTSTGKDNHPAPASGRGLETDKLSREATDLHWEKGVAPLLKALGPLAGKALNNVLVDSYEVGSQNWTPKFRDEFKRRRGYDPVALLPVVTGRVLDSPEVSARFLWDLRRTSADLFAENYVARFRDLCHKNGLEFSIEPYGNGTFDNLQIGRLGDIPMGEFWVGGAAAETIKTAASSAHTTGRPVVGAESFTADDKHGRWLVEPAGVKALGDRMFTLGVNRYIFHRYAHQPWPETVRPGMTMGPWGMHLERTQTWWEQGAAWMKYVARCQNVLQAGRFAADVARFCGEGAPNDDPGRGDLPAGFDYDGLDRTALMALRVERDGVLSLPGGARYRVLTLPESQWMTPDTLRKVAGLVKEGATVVGPRPRRSPSLSGYPACDAEVDRLAREVWGDADGKAVTERAYGKGRVVWGKPLAAVLGAPDVEKPADSGPLPWIHRRVGDADIYFVSNPQPRPRVEEVTFRVGDRSPQLWHPETGAITGGAEWQGTSDGRTRVTLRLGPAESVFVAFPRRRSAGSRADHLTRVTRESGPALPDEAAKVEIEEARYEAVDGAGGADVTARVRALVARGETEVEATNENFGDPTPFHVKRLRVRYRIDGKPTEKTADENQTLTLYGSDADIRLPAFSVGGGKLLAFAPGEYAAQTASGRTIRVSAPEPTAMPIGGPWSLAFAQGLGAPLLVTLDRLTSWTEHPDPGVRYFSGSAVYTTVFSAPADALAPGKTLILDLGRVRNFAEVTLNGRALPTLWKPPFRLDVTGLVKPGPNSLTVRVTNLWPNRLIGDQQRPSEIVYNNDGAIAALPAWLDSPAPRPPDGRVTFTTWRFWTAKDEPLPSGLLGPVVLRAVPTFELK